MLHRRDRQFGLQLGEFLPLGLGELQCHGPVHEPGVVLVAQDRLQVPVDQGADSGIEAVFCPSPAGHDSRDSERTVPDIPGRGFAQVTPNKARLERFCLLLSAGSRTDQTGERDARADAPPVPIMVPCHRAVGTHVELTGDGRPAPRASAARPGCRGQRTRTGTRGVGYARATVDVSL